MLSSPRDLPSSLSASLFHPLAVSQQIPLSTSAVPLCVDLDGTLIRSDVLWESLVLLFKQQPLAMILLPFWLLRGRAHLKRQIAERVSPNPAALPYDEAFVAFLREERRQGRRMLLVTASDRTVAEKIAAHTGLFDEVIGSNGTHNLRGSAKAAALTSRFGTQGFDYAGDSAPDLDVRSEARSAIIVCASPGVTHTLRARFQVAAEFPPPAGRWLAVRQLLRPLQWVKNLIVLVPLVTSHQLTQPAAAWPGILGLVAFCFCASAVYVFNDLLDLEADRQHATKRLRPFAAGRLPIAWGFALSPLLLLGGFLIAATITPAFTATLALYVIVAVAYCWRLKRTPLVDVFILAGLYTLRLIAGHAATGIVYSDWLLSFSMFIFLSLALVKRFQEVQRLGAAAEGLVKGRGYVASDLQLILPLGVASGYMSVLVLALYVNSDQVRLLYHRPMLLLLMCPLFLFWISRVWMVANRGRMSDDPVVYAMRDRTSYGVGLLVLGVLWLAT